MKKKALLGKGHWTITIAGGGSISGIDPEWNDLESDPSELIKQGPFSDGAKAVKATYKQYQKVGRSIQLVEIKTVSL